MCGLSPKESQSLAYDEGLDVFRLIHKLFVVGDRSDPIWQGHRQHEHCMCLLSHFLLARSDNKTTTKVIEVAQQLRECQSCMGLALVETLMGLDAFRRRKTFQFAGNPLLLLVLFFTLSYFIFLRSLWPSLLDFFLKTPFSLFPLDVWLMDKLKVVAPCARYSARDYFFQAWTIDFPSKSLWYDWMCSRATTDIVWRCPWLDLPPMTYSVFCQLAFKRQFGHDQTRLAGGIEYLASFSLQARQLPRYTTAWRMRELLAPAGVFSYGERATYLT
ncbi:hypothetical protein ACSBR2_035780 [Camellia fascicularis]